MPTVIELFRHNQWANLRLLDACAGLAEAQLEAVTPGTYGSLGETLVHLVAAEGRYVTVFTGEPEDDSFREGIPFPGVAALRERADRSGAALIAAAERFTGDEAIEQEWRGDRFTITAFVFFLQVLNHATEHRAHVCSTLTSIGIEPPILDGWRYAEETGHFAQH